MARKKDNGLDFYATSPQATEEFLSLTDIILDNNIWECACGIGTMSEALKAQGYNVYSTDIVNRGYNDETINFLECNTPFDGDIVTNPPYNCFDEFLYKGLELTKRRFCVLVPLTFIQAASRHQIIEQYKCTIYIYLRRIDIAKDGLFEKYKNRNLVKYCFLVFDKETENKEITIKYIKNNINPIKTKAMPKKINLDEVKKNFELTATEKEKQNYDSKVDKEKYLKEWNRKVQSKSNSIDISQNSEQTTVEQFLLLADKIKGKKKFTIQEIDIIENVISVLINKINNTKEAAEKEAKEAKIKELKAKIQEAEEAKRLLAELEK